MKITSQQIKQIIKEELNKVLKEMTFDERDFEDRDSIEFTKMKNRFKGGHYRSHGSLDQPVEYPEYSKKLASIYTSGEEGRNQAIDLADTLGEPIDVPLEDMGTDSTTFKNIKRPPMYKQDEVIDKYFDMFDKAGVEPTEENFESDQNIRAFGIFHGKRLERVLRTAIKDHQIMRKMKNK